jgi:hypothetical protein
MSLQCSTIDRVILADMDAISVGSSDRMAASAIFITPASLSMRSLRRSTSTCFEPMLSYTVWAETPAASAMSRTLVRV